MFLFLTRRLRGYRTALCALPLAAFGCNPAPNSIVLADETHGDEPAPVAVTVFTDKLGLYMEYPQLAPGEEARFLAHLTVLATGKPVRTGSLLLELSGEGLETQIVEAQAPERDGLFIPVGAFKTAGTYQAKLVLSRGQERDSIPLAPMVVHADGASALAVALEDHPHPPPNTVPFLLEQQWKIGLLTEEVGQRSLTKRLQVPGEIEAPHHAMGIVSAPLAGRLLPPDSGQLPRIGEHVEKGQVLGFLEPPLTRSDRAQRIANETNHDTIEVNLLVREYDLQAKALEIEQVLLQSKARGAYAGQALKRIEGLREKDLGTLADLQQAQLDVALALQESKSSLALKGALELSKQRLEELMQRTAAARLATIPKGLHRHALLAPISGEIVTATRIEGEHVEDQGTVFRLLDTSHVWVATHVSEFDFGQVSPSPGALMKLAAYPDRTFDLLGEMGGRVVSIGRLVDHDARTLPLRYEVANPKGLFRIGMFADVFLETDWATDTIAMPEEAIVMDNGQALAFVVVNGELFQKRELELGFRDGRFMQVISGLNAGDRVVTHGAYLVKLASASPAAFGAGHTH